MQLTLARGARCADGGCCPLPRALPVALARRAGAAQPRLLNENGDASGSRSERIAPAPSPARSGGEGWGEGKPPWLPLAGALLLSLLAIPAHATSEGASRITFFHEPSSSNDGITVIHPQLDVSAALGPSFDISAGYAVDIVSGATPQVFGPHTGVDAVSAATKFSDTRQEVKGGLAYTRPSAALSAGYSYGWESDYRSHTVSASTRTDLLDHNVTVALGYTHNFDSVCDNNNAAAAGQPLDYKPLASSAHCFHADMPDVVAHRLHIDTVEPSLTWTATPRLVAQLGATAQILDGFQSNPYRSVLIGRNHNTPQESLPTFRQRYAVWARGAYFFPGARLSLTAMARAYRDTWDVEAATGEIALQKYLTSSFLIGGRARYHTQRGARFYRDGRGYLLSGVTGRYWTGDRELSPMSNQLYGGRFAYVARPQQEKSSWYSEIEVAMKGEALLYHLDSPDAPNADRSSALLLQAAVAVRF